jgi:hypothetical protein
MNNMSKRLISAGLAALVLTGFAVENANAWTRSGSVATARGVYTFHGSGSCGNGTCSRSRSVTGPYGYSVSRSGSISRTGPGSYAYSRTTTGPYGGSVTRSGSIYVER